ncbi:hypothetical protein [Piscinibacter terrae]|uniref:Uncharacterized protein n=1 Tax=Piscinibacter terrae TaxID=2496871 RepID=A0A3N7HJW4_9BURK|nr:hypothetical protein [Albitalea terrae]RQP22357.1 hypothetical protein DZC73_22120 [Albitalea terrae]
MKAARFLKGVEVLDLMGNVEPIDVSREPLYEVRGRLIEAGLAEAAMLEPDRPADAVLLCEACNWAAKSVSEEFYELKGPAVDSAAALDCQSGWDGNVFYLHAEGVGVACFHDPFGQIQSEGVWPHPWSGVRRQDLAFLAIKSPALRRLLDLATRPDATLKASHVYRAAVRLAS